MLDRTQPSAPPKQVMTGDTHALAWSADSLDLGALVDDSLVHVRVEGEPDVVWRRDVGRRSAVAATKLGLYTAGPAGIVARAEATGRRVAGTFTLGLREARGGTVIAADPHGTLVALAEDGDHTPTSPSGSLTAVEASPASPWVVAAAPGIVLAWNLDAVEPRHIADAAQSAAFVTADQLIVTYVDSPAEWIDLRTPARTPLGAIAGLCAVAPSRDGQRAIDAHRFVVASGDELRLHDGDRDTPVYRHGPATWVAALPDGTLAAGFADGLVWRGKVTGGDEHVVVDPPSTTGVLEPDGRVLVGAGGELRAWRPGAPAADPTGVSLAPQASLAPALAATISPGGTLELADLGGEPADRWPIATGRMFSGVEVAPDGSAVLATTPDAVLAWHVDLLASAAATKAWLDDLTNARTDGGPTAPLSWEPMLKPPK